MNKIGRKNRKCFDSENDKKVRRKESSKIRPLAELACKSSLLLEKNSGLVDDLRVFLMTVKFFLLILFIKNLENDSPV